MSNPEATFLAATLAYLRQKNGEGPSAYSDNPLISAIASAAGGILVSGKERFLAETGTAESLHNWASGRVAENELAHPQLIAAILLWGDTWKRGS